MFSVVSVCLSTGRRVPCEHYPWLALTVQPPPPVQNPGPSPLLVTSGHKDWRANQTCSLQDPLPTADIWWLATNFGLVGILLECCLVTFHFANHMRTLADYSNTALPEDKQLCQNSEVLHVKSLRAVYLAPKSHVHVPFTEHFQCAMLAFCHKRLNVCRISNIESVIMSPRIGYFAFVTYSHRHLQ